MKESKAKKVLHGDKNQKVTHNGQLVWLEHVNESSGEALVSVMDTGEKKTVPVSELEHQGQGLR
ncbi:H-type small acid-soluble spore protein [Tissierella creatinophila]|uniref:Small, acid-soluble spore protein H n=1 Tax=Tissierella creatinophila DSM 6911 TaxID=1123403 RepID=A0A1U7M7D1_TISCR|nr:H-type small acid-soluble spore protein [Tissierella creatinophila]OLS03222.1 small, acid-soluble spore protein H [Tissierella creatinophila DSM 6911]